MERNLNINGGLYCVVVYEWVESLKSFVIFLLFGRSKVFEMGNTDTKLAFRKAVVQLTTKKTVCDALNHCYFQLFTELSMAFICTLILQALEAGDDAFWAQFWTDPNVTVSDIFTLIPATEIRSLRDENPSNLATLLYKVI